MTTERNISAWFERRERANGETFMTLAENAPSWLRDAVYEAHDGELPNDWRYETCASIVVELDDMELYELDDIDTYPMAEQFTDSYNYDLCKWVVDDIGRGCIEVESALLGSDVDAFSVIRLAQFETIANMVGILARAMARQLDGE